MIASALTFGSPPLFALAMIGLFSRPWSLILAIYQLHLLSGLMLMILGTYFIDYTHPRFYVFVIPIFCIWASVGLRKLVSWGRATSSNVGVHRRWRSSLAVLIWIAGIGSIFVPAAASLADFRVDRPFKTAGEWLRDLSTEPIRLLDTSTIISFHANAAHFWLPYSDEKTALLYIDKRNINFVVVRKSDADSRPYMRDWVENGVPHPRAKLVYSFDAGPGKRERVKIYQITR
jgi:hypothetical protein